MSVKHLDRYIQEFSYRFNNRSNQEMFTITVACLALGIPLPYAKLVGEKRIVHNRKGVNQFTQPGTTSPSAEPDEPVLGARLRGIAAFGSGLVAISLRITSVNCSRSTVT